MSAFVGEGATGPADDRPLDDREYQLLQRLLSDPFSLPQQFKTWLVSYLESSDLSLPMSAILGLNSMLGITGAGGGTLTTLPAGLIFPYGGGAAPSGSKLCDGTAYSRAVEVRLFQAIGTAFGAPDGNTFRVPDLQERVPVGKGVRSDHDTLGETEGLPVGSRGVRHQHGTHAHTTTRTTHSLAPGANVYSMQGYDLPDGPPTDPAQVGPAGTPVDTPAFITLNFIIVA